MGTAGSSWMDTGHQGQQHVGVVAENMVMLRLEADDVLLDVAWSDSHWVTVCLDTDGHQPGMIRIRPASMDAVYIFGWAGYMDTVLTSLAQIWEAQLTGVEEAKTDSAIDSLCEDAVAVSVILGGS